MPIVEFMKSTKFQLVAERLDAIFSLLGYPKSMKTDTSPPWDNNNFEHYLKVRNSMHQPSITLWPCSNRPVEQLMQMVSKTIRYNIDCQTNTWKNSICTMLLNYRNSVYPATNETPAKLFFRKETMRFHVTTTLKTPHLTNSIYIISSTMPMPKKILIKNAKNCIIISKLEIKRFFKEERKA